MTPLTLLSLSLHLIALADLYERLRLTRLRAVVAEQSRGCRSLLPNNWREKDWIVVTPSRKKRHV